MAISDNTQKRVVKTRVYVHVFNFVVLDWKFIFTLYPVKAVTGTVNQQL